MAETSPNILMIMTDQQRFDSLSCYGNTAIRTPNLDRLARSGVLFERCYVNNPVCTPSRASILTGKPLAGHGVFQLHDNLPLDEVLFPKRLGERGYQTALIGKLHVSGRLTEAEKRHPNDGFEVYEWCMDPTIHLDSQFNAYTSWLRTHHEDFWARLKEEGRTLRNFPADVHFNRWAADATCSFLDRRDTSRPFFCFMSLFDPHDPYYDCPAEWLDAVDPTQIGTAQPAEESEQLIPRAILLERRRWADNLNGKNGYADLRDIQTGYYGSIAYLDHEIGRVLDHLDRTGLAENTAVVFLSDHGDMLGDRRLLTKGPYFYDPCTRVPFIIRFPAGAEAGIPVGLRYHGLTQPNDVAATVLSLAGFTHDELARIMPHSKDLSAVVSGETPPRDLAICEYRNTGYGIGGRYYDPEVHGTMVYDGRYKLSVYHEPDPEGSWQIGELYDMVADPLETHNVWSLPEYTDTRCRLLLKLVDWKSDVEKTYVGGRGGELAPWHTGGAVYVP